MTERKKIKQTLAPHLPYGSFSKIKRALADKYERGVSVEFIRTVLNPLKDNWDYQVIKEAQEIATNVQKEIIEIKESLI